MADLTAGFLLSTGVLAALVRARATGIGECIEVSLHEAALAVQLQDLVWLEGEDGGKREGIRVATRSDLEARAAEITGGVAMNPYYRCYATADGFLAVACLNVTQRRALLELFGLGDATVDAPDVVPDDAGVLTAKVALTAEIERAVAERPIGHWLEALGAQGVPCGPVLARESVHADPQVQAAGLVSEVTQPGVGPVWLLAPFLGPGSRRNDAAPAPELGADTDAVLGELA
jgi:crotonobetainyl-CoA:carnitine CoA-transferase CaiB-like acyl-CoA transferase